MLFKFKLLLSLGAIGIVGGTGTGIYYIQNIDDIESLETQKSNLDGGLEEKDAKSLTSEEERDPTVDSLLLQKEVNPVVNSALLLKGADSDSSAVNTPDDFSGLKVAKASENT